LHERMVNTPYEANRTLTLLGPMFSFASKQKYRPKNSNPCEEIKKYPESKRERILTPEEREKLFAYLADQESKQLESIYVTNLIRLYCYTGCRVTELLTLKWSYVNYELKALLLPDSKTKWKSVTLNKMAATIIQAMPIVANNPYVFIGKNAGTHKVNISKPWDRIRKKLGLDDVRLHDLRHTYASILANTGASLHIIGEAIGSKTEPRRYAHLVNNTLEDAANKAAEAMLPNTPKPLPIKPRPIKKGKKPDTVTANKVYKLKRPRKKL
jgi:integrase